MKDFSLDLTSTEPSEHHGGQILPRVAVMGNNPAVAVLIRLIVGDICHVEHCDGVSTLRDALEVAPPSALVLLHLESLQEGGAAPVVYVSGAEAQTTDDGLPLIDCFATMSRPAELRAVIEQRLRGRKRTYGPSFR